MRERVLKAVEEKKVTLKEIGETFKLNVKTIYLWRKRIERTGNIGPSSGYQKGHSHKIKDLSEFTEFLQKDQDLTTNRIIKRFGKMCKNTAYNYLKKVGYTYKKNLSLSGKE